MRLRAEQTLERQQFLRDLFAAEPGLTVRAAQDRLRARFGQGMYPTTILNIRATVRLTSKPGSATLPVPKGRP